MVETIVVSLGQKEAKIAGMVLDMEIRQTGKTGSRGKKEGHCLWRIEALFPSGTPVPEAGSSVNLQKQRLIQYEMLSYAEIVRSNREFVWMKLSGTAISMEY